MQTALLIILAVIVIAIGVLIIISKSKQDKPINSAGGGTQPEKGVNKQQ